MSCLEPYKNWVENCNLDIGGYNYTRLHRVFSCLKWRIPIDGGTPRPLLSMTPSPERSGSFWCKAFHRPMRICSPDNANTSLHSWWSYNMAMETFPEEILSGFAFRCFTFSHAIRVYPEGSSLVALLHIARVPLHWFHLHHLVFLQLGDWNIKPVCLSIGYPIHWSKIMLSLRYIMFLIP